MKFRRNMNLFFGGLLAIFSVYFIFWGIGIIGEASKTIFIISAIFGIFMAFNIGGNDVANSFGTSVGAGTLSINQALCVAAIFEVSGAVIAGGEVISTIRSGIVSLEKIDLAPNDFIFVMMSSLIAAALWLLIATKRGWPVSTTHAIVGAIVGASLMLGVLIKTPEFSTLSLVKWKEICFIAISWVLSPLLGGLASYIVYSVIKRYILDYNAVAQREIDAIKAEKKEFRREYKRAFEKLDEIQKIAYTEAMNRDLYTMKDPNFEIDELDSPYYKKMVELDRKKEHLKSHKALEFGIPIIAAVGIAVISTLLLFKGLSNINLGISNFVKYFIILAIGVASWVGFYVFAKTLRRSDLSKSTFLMFSWLQVFTACGFAFSHGSNDIANAVGPFAAIIDTLQSGKINSDAAVYPIIMLTFGIALVVGLWFIGKEVIATVGTNLTKIHPASGFSAELSAAGIVMSASILGLPVSSTHILIGAVLGIGIVNSQTNWRLMRPIALAWIITLPAAALLSAIGFVILRGIF